MKKISWLLIGIFLICAVIYLGDFVLSVSHPFAELGAGLSCLVMSMVLVVASKRSCGKGV